MENALNNIETLNDLYSLKINKGKLKGDNYYRIEDIPEIFSGEEFREQFLLQETNEDESEELLLKNFLNSSVGKIKYSILQDKMDMDSIKSNLQNVKNLKDIKNLKNLKLLKILKTLKNRDSVYLPNKINYLNCTNGLKHLKPINDKKLQKDQDKDNDQDKGQYKNTIIRNEENFSLMKKNIEKASQTRKEFEAKFHPSNIKRKFLNKEKIHNPKIETNILKYAYCSKTPSNDYLRNNFGFENLDNLNNLENFENKQSLKSKHTSFTPVVSKFISNDDFANQSKRSTNKIQSNVYLLKKGKELSEDRKNDNSFNKLSEIASNKYEKLKTNFNHFVSKRYNRNPRFAIFFKYKEWNENNKDNENIDNRNPIDMKLKEANSSFGKPILHSPNESFLNYSKSKLASNLSKASKILPKSKYESSKNRNTCFINFTKIVDLESNRNNTNSHQERSIMLDSFSIPKRKKFYKKNILQSRKHANQMFTITDMSKNNNPTNRIKIPLLIKQNRIDKEEYPLTPENNYYSNSLINRLIYTIEKNKSDFQEGKLEKKSRSNPKTNYVDPKKFIFGNSSPLNKYKSISHKKDSQRKRLSHFLIKGNKEVLI